MSDGDTSIHDDRFGYGFTTAIGLVALAGVVWAVATYTPVVVGVALSVGKFLTFAVALVAVVYALGYFWTDVAPAIAARLGAWYAYLSGDRDADDEGVSRDGDA